jgi:hypothetical protein
VQGVVQRAEIGIDLLEQVARQEAKLFTGFDAGRVRMMRLTLPAVRSAHGQAMAR